MHNAMWLFLLEFSVTSWKLILFTLLLSLLPFVDIKGGLAVATFFLSIFGFSTFEEVRKQDAIREYRILPISRNTFANIFWVIGVLYFPLTYLLLSPIIALTGAYIFLLPALDILILIILPPTFGVIFSSLYVLLPYIHRMDNKWVQSWNTFIRSLYVCSMILGILFIIFGMDHHSSRFNTTCIILLFACPVIAYLSFLHKDQILRPVMPVISKHYKQDSAVTYYSKNIILFWFEFWSRNLIALGIGWLITITGGILMALNKGSYYIYGDSLYLFASMFLGFVPPIFSTGWFSDIRPLRTLPMSSVKLSMFMLSLPVTLLVCTAVPLIFLYPATSLSIRFVSPLELIGIVLGASIISCNIFVRFGESGAYLVLVGILLVPVFMHKEEIFSSDTVALSIFVLGLMMFPVLVYQINRSDVVYRHRNAPKKGGHSGKLGT